MKKKAFTFLGNGLAVPFIVLAIGAGLFWILAMRCYEEADPERFQSF